MPDNNLEIPEPDGADVAHTGITTLLSAIPGVAGLGELFKFTVASSLEKRNKKWMEAVREMLLAHDARFSQTVEELAQNEEFTSLLLQATQAASKTHLDEKLEAFKNILSHALEPKASFDKSALYLDLASRLSIPHIKILKASQDALIDRKIAAQSEQDFNRYIRTVIPESEIELPVQSYMIRDLEQLRLLEHYQMDAERQARAALPFYAPTRAGMELLNYISR